MLMPSIFGENLFDDFFDDYFPFDTGKELHKAEKKLLPHDRACTLLLLPDIRNIIYPCCTNIYFSLSIHHKLFYAESTPLTRYDIHFLLS